MTDEPPAENQPVADATPTKAVRKPPTERQKARAAMPAVFIDTWSAVWWDGHLRLVLGEYLYQTENYRFVALMEWHDAETLAQEILKTIAEGRAEIKAREVAKASSEPLDERHGEKIPDDTASIPNADS